jgi:hypothetical protein
LEHFFFEEMGWKIPFGEALAVAARAKRIAGTNIFECMLKGRMVLWFRKDRDS